MHKTSIFTHLQLKYRISHKGGVDSHLRWPTIAQKKKKINKK